jgi:Zn-finger nucleic acid-binding protein
MNSLLKIKEFFLLIKNKFIEQGVYYYNIILGNFHSVVKKNNKNSTLLSPVVSEQVAELPPLKNNDQDIVVFSSPNVPGNNQGEPVVLNSDPSANRLGLAMTPPPGETFIEDVFSTVPQPQYHQEKIKLGATSYPNKIAPTQLQSINQSVVADTANQAISILSSEDITPLTTESVAQVDSSVEKKFNYQQLEIKDANVENNQSLLPDLSNLEKQKNSNIQSSVVGVDQGLVNKVFNASGSNTQSRSFKKETRQRNDYKDHKTTSGSLTKKKKKKKKNKT